MNRSKFDELSEQITAKYLEMVAEMSRSTITQTDCFEQVSGYYYFKITEISKRWLTDEKPIWSLMSNLFVGLYSVNVPISVVFNFNGTNLDVYFGTPERYLDIVNGVLRGTFPKIFYQTNDANHIAVFGFEQIKQQTHYAAVLKGNPVGNENFNSVFQIDSVIKGMTNKKWCLSIFAYPVEKTQTLKRQQYWLREASMCSELSDISFNETDNSEMITYKKTYGHSDQYAQKVAAFTKKTVEALSTGEWCAGVNFSAENYDDLKLLGGLLTAAFFDEQSLPEPIHAMYCPHEVNGVVVDALKKTHSQFLPDSNMPFPEYGSFLTGEELAVLCAFPTIDTTGFSVSEYVEFDVNRMQKGDLSIGKILSSGQLLNSDYKISTNEFNRHCLVIGLTGSGKTNTVKSLICALTKQTYRPFMVIEPAKKEYWELYKLGYDNLQIYSVGSTEKNAHTFCINPFERATYIDENGQKKSVPIQTHIDFVFAAFKASFIMYTPMPYVLERAIYSIYEDCGWDIHNDVNTTGNEIYPTIEDLFYKIPSVVTQMGYDQKMRNDLIGSLQARVNSMRLGSKGDTLNVKKSFPFEHLLNGNIVVELEDIGDDDVKAFIISMLLVNLLEYRRQQTDCQLEVRHLMFIEEAHRLLKNVNSGTGENADPRGAAVEFFCNLLAELRSKGQGFIVADQIPSKLAPDLIKNTNLKITHRTVDETERHLIGGAMHMSEEQIDELASLKQGVAAVYSEGDNRPKLVKPPYAGSFESPDKKDLDRAQVLSAVAQNCISVHGQTQYQSLTDALPEICRMCNPHCLKKYTDILRVVNDGRAFDLFANEINPNHTKTCTVKLLNDAMEQFCSEHMTVQSLTNKDKCCMLGCLLDRWDLKKETKNNIMTSFIKVKGE